MISTLDTSVLIAYSDRSDTHHAAAQRAIMKALDGRAVIPMVVYSELLTGAARRSRHDMDAVDQVIDALNFELLPLNREIGRRAAELRAEHKALKTPDALVIAAGEVLESDVILTFDTKWKKLSPRVRIPR